MDIRTRIVAWLKTKTKADIIYVKKNPDFDIFLAHPGMCRFDAEKLVEDPEKTLTVEPSLSHGNRLKIIRKFSRKYGTTFIILNPFDTRLEKRFQGKVAIITFFPVRL